MGFAAEELERHHARARELMHQAALDALVVSSPPNWRYFTDLDLILLVAPSRPVFFVLPLSGDPAIVAPALFAPDIAGLPYLHRLEMWSASRPHDDGVTLLARILADMLGSGVPEGESASRFGHGLGLGLTEPPSVHPADHTRLVPGMVLAIEPGLVYPVAGRPGPRLMVHEENIVVTPDGARLLTERVPASLPVVPAFLQENT